MFNMFIIHFNIRYASSLTLFFFFEASNPSWINMTASARGEILQWVNDTLTTYHHHNTTPSGGSSALHYASLQAVPAKAIARFLNALFGPKRCPLHEIMFDDETPTAALRNRRKVIELARCAGFDGKLDAVKWSDGQDFANELGFWKWLYSQRFAHPIPAGYDFSLRPQGSPRVAVVAKDNTDGSSDQQQKCDHSSRKRARDDDAACSGAQHITRAEVQAAHAAASQAPVPQLTSNDGVSTTNDPAVDSLLQSTMNSLRNLQKIQERLIQACREQNQQKLLAVLNEIP